MFHSCWLSEDLIQSWNGEGSHEMDRPKLYYDRFISVYYRSLFYLRNHVWLLETLSAICDMFGQMY